MTQRLRFVLCIGVLSCLGLSPASAAEQALPASGPQSATSADAPAASRPDAQLSAPVVVDAPSASAPGGGPSTAAPGATPSSPAAGETPAAPLSNPEEPEARKPGYTFQRPRYVDPQREALMQQREEQQEQEEQFGAAEAQNPEQDAPPRKLVRPQFRDPKREAKASGVLEEGEEAPVRGSALVRPGIGAPQARALALSGGHTGYNPVNAAKQLERGKAVPPGVQRKPVPQDMRKALPAYQGYEWWAVGRDLVLIKSGSEEAAHVLRGVFK